MHVKGLQIAGRLFGRWGGCIDPEAGQELPQAGLLRSGGLSAQSCGGCEAILLGAGAVALGFIVERLPQTELSFERAVAERLGEEPVRISRSALETR